MAQKMRFLALGSPSIKGVGVMRASLVFLYSDVMAGLRLDVFSDIFQSPPISTYNPG